MFVCVSVCTIKAYPQYFDDKTNLTIVQLSERKHSLSATETESGRKEVRAQETTHKKA